MQNILYLESAMHLGAEQDCLTVISDDSENMLVHIKDLDAVVVESAYCSLTVPSLLLCSQNSVPVIICSQEHLPEIYCLDYYRHSELLDCLNRQLGWRLTHTKEAWLGILKAKIQHQLDVLGYFKCEAETIAIIQGYLASLEERGLTAEAINAAESISARVYFNALFGKEFRRFESDSTNYALNYGYAIIRSQILMAITVKGLHPALGIWHHSVRNRFNLADDFIEVLRPLVDFKVKQIKGAVFGKEQKIAVLTLLHSNVYWQDKPYSLKQALNLFTDHFINFMNGNAEILHTLEIRLDSYEPD